MLRKINGIYVTEVVSFPRSGHTWLSRILKYYFKDKLNYCEKYNDVQNVIDLNENTNLEKNHDFELTTEIKSDRKYLIQFRNRNDCLNSLFKYYFFNHDKNLNRIDTDITNNKFTANEFLDIYGSVYCDWIIEKRQYYSNFLKKWVESSVPNSKIVEYEKLKTNTLSECTSIIEFLTDDECDRFELLKSILYSNRPHETHFN